MKQLLLIRSSQAENRYGRFTAEILRAEGFSGFGTVDLDEQPLPDLGADDLAILTRCYLRRSETDRLEQAVRQGARLVCFQPYWALAERFGWTAAMRAIHPGWIKTRGDPIQTHLPVALYRAQPSTAAAVAATAVADDWRDTGYPAVIRQPVGLGQVAFFFYDLPEAVARIRFGNPDLSGILTSGTWKWNHACDLFDGYVDDRVLHRPQADLHGQLLADVLTDICPYPLPRLWYYQQTMHRSACVFQSDGDGSMPAQFAELSDALLRRGGTATFYLLQQTRLGPDEVRALRDQGHTFGPHPNAASRFDELYYGFPDVLREETESFRKRFGAVSPTLQSHCAPWLGYMDFVPAHLANGYRLLFAYQSGPARCWSRFLCGSGRPMRFYNRDGVCHDCWQQPIVIYDDESIREWFETDSAAALRRFEELLQPALREHHSAMPFLSHPVSFSTYSRPVVERCLDRFVGETIPMYNADQWLAFTAARDQIEIAHEKPADGRLRLLIRNPAAEIPLMLPARFGMRDARLNGVPVEPVTQKRLGRDYLFVDLDPAADGEQRLEVSFGG